MFSTQESNGNRKRKASSEDTSSSEVQELLESVIDELQDIAQFAEDRGNYFIFVHDPHADFMRQTLAAIVHRISITKSDVEDSSKILSRTQKKHSSRRAPTALENNCDDTPLPLPSQRAAANERNAVMARNGSVENSDTPSLRRAPVNRRNVAVAQNRTVENDDTPTLASPSLRRSSANRRRNTEESQHETIENDNTPTFPPPSNGKEYTKQEAIDILSKMTKKERNKTVLVWIYEKRIPIESPIQMNKIVREARENKPMNMEWREGDTKAALPYFPPPDNGTEYTKREAIDILLKMKTRDRNKTITFWIAEKKIPVVCQGSVITALKQAESDPSSVTEWVRWGKAKVDDNEESAPSFPPPNNDKEYTKLEAINVLSKMAARDRNTAIGIWIREKKIPIAHPLSMLRILKEAKSNKPMKSINWRQDDTIPWSPPPANGKQYEKQEMIDILVQMKPRDRSKLISLWVNEKKIKYKSPATVGNLVRQAIKQKSMANAEQRSKSAAITDDPEIKL